MKSVIFVALALAAVAAAAPPSEPIKILRSGFEVQPDGAYVFSYETENGINRAETGALKQALDAENKPHDVIVVRGTYSYIDSEGKPELITYFADENGYHAEGESIPKAPPARR